MTTRLTEMAIEEGNIVINNRREAPKRREGPVNVEAFFQDHLGIRVTVVREFFAEIIGTFLLCVIGLSAVAQYKFFAKDAKSASPGYVNFLPVNVAFGLGATVAILVSGKVSGAHLNPAVSFAMFLTGRLTPLRFLIYVIGQLLGAFLAAVIVFVLYLDALKSYGENMHSLDTAGIFGTYPGRHLSIFGGLFDQTFGTFILVLVVLAITDKRNVEIQHGTVAILVGFTIFLIGTAFAYNCGYAVNPARDFAPRLFTLMAGWGTKTFTAGTYFFWIPIVGPMLGALIATFIYIFFISAHWVQTDYL